MSATANEPWLTRRAARIVGQRRGSAARFFLTRPTELGALCGHQRGVADGAVFHGCEARSPGNGRGADRRSVLCRWAARKLRSLRTCSLRRGTRTTQYRRYDFSESGLGEPQRGYSDVYCLRADRVVSDRSRGDRLSGPPDPCRPILNPRVSTLLLVYP